MGDYEAVKKETDELRALVAKNDREGWSPADRAAFRDRLAKNEKRVEDVKPADWQQVAYVLAYLTSMILFGKPIVGLMKRKPEA